MSKQFLLEQINRQKILACNENVKHLDCITNNDANYSDYYHKLHINHNNGHIYFLNKLYIKLIEYENYSNKKFKKFIKIESKKNIKKINELEKISSDKLSEEQEKKISFYYGIDCMCTYILLVLSHKIYTKKIKKR